MTPSDQTPIARPSDVVILDVRPTVDCGRFAAKRVVGDELVVQATILRHGHDLLTARLRYRPNDDENWREIPMTCVNPGLDLWEARVWLDELGTWQLAVTAWWDHFGSWRRDLLKRMEAGQDVASEILEGLQMVQAAAAPPKPADASELDYLMSEDLAEFMTEHPNRRLAATSEPVLEVVVDREAARFATWYEFFPRSQAPLTAGPRSGTFRDCIERLPDIADMGFDVVYLPPIHPIGRTHRKGKNNSLVAVPGDPGSPWAIGNELGGFTSIEPSLGTLADFDAFVRAARGYGIEIALDFAIQCSPDHPWVREHPSWFSHRPDGSIKYAENPPKKYQDIYPLNFDTDDWAALWRALRDVVLFWIGHGVKTFRVDNPHTKPIPFWAWLIREVKRAHPEAIFLSEAFTRPRMMQVLAKAGFTQSYTYFTWRNEKKELTEYLTELTQPPMVDYFRGNLFANTPDILHAYLQEGGKPAFKIRYLLAATLSSLCGIYSGFELCENVPVKPGSEEYLDSEKYEIKPRDWDAPGNLKSYLAIVNRTRREHRALQLYDNLSFHASDNPHLLCYGKATMDGSDVVIMVVNLDPKRAHHGMIHLNRDQLHLPGNGPLRVHDQFTNSIWEWGEDVYVRLDPQVEPGHLVVVQRH